MDLIRIRLVDDLRCVLRYAWSVRLIALAFVADLAQGLVDLLSGTTIVSPHVLLAANVALAVGAVLARVIAQAKVSNAAGTWVENIRAVLRYAWSVRILFLVAVLNALQAGVAFYAGTDIVSPSVLVAANMGLMLAAFVARLIAQDKVSGAEGDA